MPIPDPGRAVADCQSSRVVPTLEIHNFRDYGDYPIVGGGRLRRGLLYRSAEHGAATDKDLRLVGEIGFAAVVDLRGARERAAAPCRRPAGFTATVHFADGETSGLAPHQQVLMNAVDAVQVRELMREVYAGMPFRPRLVEILRRYFRVLAETDGPTLIHCLAGKDRTGLAVALVHTAMGVHIDDVLADYLLTNTAGDPEARIAAVSRGLEARSGARLSEEAMHAIMTVEVEYLRSAYDAIEARHGSIDAYLEQVLGVSRPLREAVVAQLVV